MNFDVQPCQNFIQLKMFASIYSEDYVIISANMESKIILVSWRGKCSSKEYRNTLEHALEIAKDFKFEHWITDTLVEIHLTPEDNEWVENKFIPKALSIINKVALVISEDSNRKTLGKNVDAVFESNAKNLGYFNTVHDAEKWILHAC